MCYISSCNSLGKDNILFWVAHSPTDQWEQKKTNQQTFSFFSCSEEISAPVEIYPAFINYFTDFSERFAKNVLLPSSFKASHRMFFYNLVSTNVSFLYFYIG